MPTPYKFILVAKLFALLCGCSSLPAPRPLSPETGADFHHFPRTTDLTWTAVPGAESYSVEIDCFHCCWLGKWCTEVGKPRLAASGIKTTSYRFDWVGMNLGRWRVWAVGAEGRESARSEWRDFYYSR